jgi:hypothetical protein
MKTFEEALETVLASKGEYPQKYRTLMDEIYDHEQLRVIIGTVVADQIHTPDEQRVEMRMELPVWLYTLMSTAFCNGVMIGIEMEKPE